jgi:hypothetical protein
MAGGGDFTAMQDPRRSIQPVGNPREMAAPPSVPMRTSLPNSGLARFGANFSPYRMPAYTPQIFQPQALAPLRQFGSPLDQPGIGRYGDVGGSGVASGDSMGGFGPSAGMGMTASDGFGGHGSVGGMGIGDGIGMGIGESMGMSGGSGMSGAGGLGAGMGVGESMGMSGGTGMSGTGGIGEGIGDGGGGGGGGK